MRIGILGGTFDPIHNGHLALAQAAKSQLNLDQIFFVPARIPPHSKQAGIAASPELRLRMVEAAIRDVAGFLVSKMEIEREGVSYSVDTIREFRQLFPVPHELVLLVGADWAYSLGEWKEIDAIFELCHVVVASRPGFDMSKVSKQIMLMEFKSINISSSQIRELIRMGRAIESLVPLQVQAIIKEEHLYRS